MQLPTIKATLPAGVDAPAAERNQPSLEPAATRQVKGADRPEAAQPGGKDAAREVESALDSINKTMKSLSHRLEFSIDEDSQRQVVKVVDPDTKEVIRQMPSKEALEIAKALDRLQGLLIRQQA
jgi:flagellar protein FlaG